MLDDSTHTFSNQALLITQRTEEPKAKPPEFATP